MRATDYKFKILDNVKLNSGGNDGGDGMDLEPRVAKIEANVENINKILIDLDKDIRELRSEIKSNFLWLLGIFIPLFVTGSAATILTIIYTFSKFTSH